MTRPRLIVVGPLPPPNHGVTISTSLVLANPLLAERFALEHLDTSDPRSERANIGRWDLTNITVALRSVARLARRLGGERGVVYLPLSQGMAPFLRDALFILLASLRGWRVAAHLRGGEFDVLYRAQPRPVRWCMRHVLRRVDSMGVMGPALRSKFAGLVDAERIAVVPNGTPDLGVDGGVRDPGTVLFFSNLRRRKGVVEALDAAERVISRHPQARFRFVGGWEDEQLARELRERAARLGDRIAFEPAVGGEDKRAILLSAGVLLFPPVLAEGHPRVVLEALAAGLPVVTTDRGAIADTVIDGQSGFVLPDPDPEQLAERLLRLLDDRALWDRMSRAARERYLEAFTQEVADRTLAEWLDGVARA